MKKEHPLDFLINPIIYFLEKIMLKRAKFIVEKPLFYVIMVVYNFYFYFDSFSTNYFILFIFILSAMAGVLIFLQKYSIVNFLNTSKPKTKLKDFFIYLFISIYFFGVIGGAFLFFFEITFQIKFLIYNFSSLFQL